MFNSCSKDNDDDNSTVTLEGTWKLTAWNVATPYDLNGDGTVNTNILQELNCYNNETVVFVSGGTGLANSTSYADIMAELTAGTVDEYTYTIDCIQENESFPFTWSLNGNTITFDAGPDAFVATLSGNTFSYVVPEGLDIPNEDGTETVILQDLTFVYTKQ